MKGESYILEVEGLTVAYSGRTVIDGFSMQLKRGGLVGIVGTSGSGKSSIVRAILGFVPIESGVMKFDGIEVKSGQMNALRHRTAYLPQDLSFPCEWVKEVLEMPFAFRCNRDVKVTDEVWHDCFRRLGLESDIIEKRLNEMSGGQRQRMMLGIVAMLDKDLIFLDEPTSSLDASSTELVIDFLKELSRKGKTIIAVTHDKELASVCDRVIDLSTL